jgi:DNA-directed RNA polymerase specialized sigma24 family protein
MSSSALSREAFERLQALLDRGREQAGTEYEHLRRVLIDFFRWRKCTAPEDLADEVFDRVGRQLERGEDIESPRAYALGVARRVYLEVQRHPARRAVPLDLPLLPDTRGDPEGLIERAEAERDVACRLACLHECLDALPPETRALFSRYHEGKGQARIEQRKRLADELGVSNNALRIRICRIADDLAVKVEARLRQRSRS